MAGSRRSRLLDLGRDGTRGALVATTSTIVVFAALGWLIVSSPGWPEVRRAFFNAEIFAESFPKILAAFWVNVQLFLMAEAVILVFALFLAVMRMAPGPALFPFRLLSVIYTDLFRSVPGILVIFLLAFGVPALRLPGVPREPFVWGLVALVLVYSAYVSEVYRAGIESVHPSQEAAARSLGLSRFAALRFVILPQAVRRVIPPLLNDFIGLQKDTALVSTVGIVEGFRRSQILQSTEFNFTPYLATALIFLIVTVPMARLVDRLVARDRRRQRGLGATR